MENIFSNSTLILGITTPIPLIAFLISIYYRIKYLQSKNQLKELKLCPENKRSDLIKSLVVDYPSLIELNNLSDNHKYKLAMEQIRNKEKERQRKFYTTVFITLLLLIAVLVFALKPNLSKESKPKEFTDLHSEKITLNKLSSLEKSFFYPIDCDLRSTNDTSIMDLYFQENDHIVKHLNNSKNLHQVIFISATSGYGKSTFISNLCETILKEYSKVNIIDYCAQTNLFKDSLVDLIFENKLDNQTIKVNKLLYSKFNKFEIQNFFNSTEIKKSFLILDDLDEVHPKLANHIIKKSFNFINDCSTPKTLILIGRPEVFNEYMRSADLRKEYRKEYKGFELNQIKYDTYAKLRLRLLNYNRQMGKEWNKEQIDKYTKEICRYSNLNHSISYSLSNLSLGNIILPTIIEKEILKDSIIKEYMFSDLLDRANQKHIRPSFDKPSNLNQYIDALEFVAAKYHEVDKDGYFIVQPTDYIEFSSNRTNSIYSVYVTSLLNRSGLITIVPFNNKIMKYRFEPFWLHRYLITRYNSNCK